jgi:hypothetical protein
VSDEVVHEPTPLSLCTNVKLHTGTEPAMTVTRPVGEPDTPTGVTATPKLSVVSLP